MFRLLLLMALTAGAQAATDPTRPSGLAEGRAEAGVASAKPVKATHLELQAIRRLGRSYSAMIDGRHMHPGEMLGDIRIVAIDDLGITIERGGARERILLRPQLTKRIHE